MAMPVSFRSTSAPLRFAFAAVLASPCAIAFAGAPHYHLQTIEIPGANDVYAYDVNAAGQVVGYYVDENFINRAFVYDPVTGAHTLAVPTSDNADVFSQAQAINDAGQIVGNVQVMTGDGTTSAPGVLWDAADPSSYTLITGDSPAVALTPADINNDGTVVGLKANLETGEAFHGFVWTKETGVVDYGTTDTSDPSINASWTAINDSGQLVGIWNFQFAAFHASVGEVGTPEMLPMSEASDAVQSAATAINASGTRVGYMDVDGSGNAVPVVFDADGNATAIDGATFGLATGQALGINDAGVIVGRALDFSTFSFKAFIAIDGAVYDVLDVVDNDAGYPYLLTAQAVNSNGVIVGLARVGDLDVGSYILTPMPDDAVFEDGFDP
jgi:probable HAF family extracellular repeat protein